MSNLSLEDYNKYFLKYLQHKSFKLKKENAKCESCKSGIIEINESQKRVSLNCNSDTCDNWILQLPQYYLYSIELEKSKKIKSFKKLQERFNKTNDLENKTIRLNELLQEYKDLVIDKSSYNSIYNSKKQIMQIQNEIINILNDPINLYSFTKPAKLFKK